MISGTPYFVIASSSAATATSAPRLFDNRDAKTRRVAQSSTTVRYTKPRRIGTYIVSIARIRFGVSMPSAQQIRIDRMRAVVPAGVHFAVQRLDVHLAHQRRHVLAADAMALAPEQIAQHPRAGKLMLQMQLIDTSHQRQI